MALSGDESIQVANCARKTRYLTKSAAQQGAEKSMRGQVYFRGKKAMKQIYAYQCDTCAWWHLTRNLQK